MTLTSDKVPYACHTQSRQKAETGSVPAAIYLTDRLNDCLIFGPKTGLNRDPQDIAGTPVI